MEQSRTESAMDADLRSAEDCGYFCGYVDTTSELFERRLGRPLTAGESATLSKHCITTYFSPNTVFLDQSLLFCIKRVSDELFCLTSDQGIEQVAICSFERCKTRSD